MSTPLTLHVRKFTALSDAEERLLGDFFVTREVKRRAHLYEAEEVCSSLYFVESGLLRLHSVDENGAEKTLQFGLEGWWIGDLDSFARTIPSVFSLQAVETSRVTEITKAKYEPLFDAVPPMERYFRRVFQRGFAAALRRIHINESTSATERYHGFLKAYPDFVDRVPQYMLASFLGFSPEFLSKIRGRKE